MPRPLTPAEREIASAARLVAEMSRFHQEPDERLVAAGVHLEHALGLVADFASGVPFRGREADTEPCPGPPPSARRELPTLPDGAE
jgi:hypothetical protein